MAICVPYFQIQMLGVLAVGINLAFRGSGNGVGLSYISLRTLIAMQGVNLLVSYVLVFGKLGFDPMGASGAAVAMATATYFGVMLHVLTALG